MAQTLLSPLSLLCSVGQQAGEPEGGQRAVVGCGRERFNAEGAEPLASAGIYKNPMPCGRASGTGAITSQCSTIAPS
jgi:hypothetical protein